MAVDRSHELLSLTTDVVIAHVTTNDVAMGELPALIASIHEGLSKASEGAPAAAEPQKPAVPIRSSIKPDHLVCLEDGRKMTMLKRYLMTHYRLTPDAYRAKWSLPANYPMVAPDYAARRRAIAQGNDFGRARAKEAAAALKPAKKAPPVVQAAPTPAEKEVPVVEAAPKPVKKAVRAVKAVSVPAEKVAPVAEVAPKPVKKAIPAAKAAAAPAGKVAPVIEAAPKPVKKAVRAVKAVSAPAEKVVPVAEVAPKPVKKAIPTAKAAAAPAGKVAEAAPAPAAKAGSAKRKVLKPLFATERPPVAEGGAAAADEGKAQPLDILRMAITHMLCVTTTYNKRRVLLAPHIVFNRHDEPYLRAVTIELDDKRPKEAKLGTFKLVGLGPISLTGRSFKPFADYRASAPEYAGTTLVGLP